MKKVLSVLIVILLLVPFVLTTSAFDSPTQFNVKEINAAPTLDGKVSESEWGKPLLSWNGAEETDYANTNSEKNWLYVNYGAAGPIIEKAKKAKIDIYACWDDKNLYIAAVETLPGFAQTYPDSEVYKDCCMQIQFVGEAPKSNLTIYEYGFSVDKKGNTLQTRWTPVKKTNDYKAKVVKNGDVITYEIIFPWTELDYKGGIKEGSKFGLTYGFTIGNKAAPFAAIQFGKSLLNKASANTVLSVLTADSSTPKPTDTPKPTATPTPKPDVPSSWAKAEVDEAVAAKLVPTALQSKYTSSITRSDFCDLVVNMIEVKSGKKIADFVKEATGKDLTDKPFPDTASANVNAANKLGIVNGRTNGNFDPAGLITRQEASKMLALTAKALGADITAADAGFADSAKIADWAKEYVNYVFAKQVMAGTGNNNFSPVANYTREQSILTILRLFKALK